MKDEKLNTIETCLHALNCYFLMTPIERVGAKVIASALGVEMVSLLFEAADDLLAKNGLEFSKLSESAIRDLTRTVVLSNSLS